MDSSSAGFQISLSFVLASSPTGFIILLVVILAVALLMILIAMWRK